MYEIENFIMNIENLCNERHKMHEKEPDTINDIIELISFYFFFRGFTT